MKIRTQWRDGFRVDANGIFDFQPLRPAGLSPANENLGGAETTDPNGRAGRAVWGGFGWRGEREKLGEERAKAGGIFPTYKYKCGAMGNIHCFWGEPG